MNATEETAKLEIEFNAERQVGFELDQIRRDHVARYEWINSQLESVSKIVDVACGVGYGSYIMAKDGHTVTGIDISSAAIEYGRKYWKHPRVKLSKGDLSDPKDIKKTAVAVAFECIEHIEDPRPMLKALRKSSKVLFASVPNEDEFPYLQGGNTILHHFRHYTLGQFQGLLAQCGWEIASVWGQDGWESEVEEGANGRTLIVKCIRGEIAKPITFNQDKPATAPKHIAILGLGPSLDEYVEITKRMGGRHRYCDEVWPMNALGSILSCDRIFHMDDIRIQEIRAKAKPEGNTAAMVEWLRHTTIPVTTSRPHHDYPALQAFPLVAVLNEFDAGYFNSTAAYAVAYAIWIGVEKISLFGCDYTYPNVHDAEKGRACVEFWLGIASERGIRLVVPKTSTLLDALHTQAERFYGYDTLELNITQDGNGKIDIEFTECAELPTAAKVEDNYDHTKHPNALMSEVEDDV